MSQLKFQPGRYNENSRIYPRYHIDTTGLNKDQVKALKKKFRAAIVKFQKSNVKYNQREFVVRDWLDNTIIVARLK